MKRQLFILDKPEELSPRLASWYSQLVELRSNLLKNLEDVDQELLDFTPDERKIETIGTLLLHIAAIEWSWIFEDIDGEEMDFEEWKHAFALRPSVNIPQLAGKGMIFYLERLAKVRDEVYQRLTRMNDSDLDQKVESSDGVRYSIEWILYHIIEHEALHLGQVSMLKRLYRLKNQAG
ncbi:MAG: DinB family protein [Candidatus Odinarchaeota archaeon]